MEQGARGSRAAPGSHTATSSCASHRAVACVRAVRCYNCRIDVGAFRAGRTAALASRLRAHAATACTYPTNTPPALHLHGHVFENENRARHLS